MDVGPPQYLFKCPFFFLQDKFINSSSLLTMHDVAILPQVTNDLVIFLWNLMKCFSEHKCILYIYIYIFSCNNVY